ncbi:unnamed protein product [Bursaphelenchus xylophilus]|uniref:glucuronosyltransferase n=1 Tax=Bursaphelenchus xylophilus TaxID=6326 RepID=A0A1I7RYQ2_BURXY|nr:unnamed protein product [Bursaphelenchus xylophilus]CAG9092393.1 unnamed protein product [Bursaphelenchus xylophilus]
MKLLFILSLLLLAGSGLGLKFLVYNPKFGGSHALLMGKLADELAGAGHEVVVVQTVLNENLTYAGHTNKKIRLIEVRVQASIAELSKDGDKMWTTEKSNTNLRSIGKVFRDGCYELYNNKPVINELKGEHFDLGVGEWFDVCGLGLFKMIGLQKWITVFGSAVPPQFMSMLGVPASVSFVPGLFDASEARGFWTRFENVFGFLYAEKYIFPGFLGSIGEAYEVFDSNLDYRDLIANSSFFWVNTDEFVDFPRPISHKYVNIGGFGMRKNGKNSVLEPKYQKIFQKAVKGAIYMSFGSVAQSQLMPAEMKSAFLEAFKEFPEVQFIWKYENESDHITANYSNVHVERWLPQREIISHPKALIFITHGGMNSITEATYAGIPLICVPLFGDQLRNAAMVQAKGTAKVINKFDLVNKEKIVEVLTEVLNDKRYKLRAQELSQLLKDKPDTPEQRIIKTAEFAAKHDVHKHLELAGRNMNIFQYYNVDVFLAILVLINLTALGLAVAVIFFRTLFSSEEDEEEEEEREKED